MEGAGPLLFAAVVVPVLLGLVGLVTIRKHRLIGVILLSVMVVVSGVIGLFAMG